jgi:hypothetical protein
MEEDKRSKPALMRLGEFAKAINAAPAYVSALTRAKPRIEVVTENNIKYIDTDKYPVSDWKKRGTK